METKVGTVTHYYTDLGVAVIELSETLKTGNTIHIQGATTDFTQEVSSMQIDNDSIEKANAGDDIGMKVTDRVREGDNVYKVEG